MARPNAYNSWQGNDFIIPGLPVRPTYSAALPKDDTGAISDTLSQLGFRVDDAGRGSGEGLGGISNGQQPTREADSFGDLATSAAKGIGMMSGPFGLATGLYGASQMTADKQAKPGWGWGDFAKAALPGGGLMGMFGGGDTVFSGAGGANRATGPTLGGVSPIDEQAFQSMLDVGNNAGGSFGGDLGAGGVGSAGGGGAGGDFGPPGSWAKGGPVKRGMLAGPNPPGPDDGLGYLDEGEEVVSKKNVRALKGKYGPDLFELVHKGRLPAKR